jgi:hypothetical protein
MFKCSNLSKIWGAHLQGKLAATISYKIDTLKCFGKTDRSTNEQTEKPVSRTSFSAGLFGLWCLTSLTTIFQLYRGGQFYWWRKPSFVLLSVFPKHFRVSILYDMVAASFPWRCAPHIFDKFEHLNMYIFQFLSPHSIEGTQFVKFVADF